MMRSISEAIWTVREKEKIDIFVEPAITAYNRLESRPRTEDFTRSLRAEIRDALWLLTRQWQMGEFESEDAGSPIDARLMTRHRAVELFALGKGPASPLDEALPLEYLVEREGFTWTTPMRIEAGQVFLKALPVAQRAAIGAQARATFKLDFDADWNKLQDSLSLYRLAKDVAIDGKKLLDSHHAGQIATDLNLNGAAAAAAEAAAAKVAAWRRRIFGPEQATPGPGWQPDRLAYDVSVATGRQDDGQIVLEARNYSSGTLDWYSYDNAGTGTRLPLPDEPDDHPRDETRLLSFIPTAAAFAGMPNPRFWEMEDRQVNFGKLQAKTNDLLLLTFAELGLVFGDDWFVLPYEMPLNTICEVKALVVTDVFGDRTVIPSAYDPDNSDWQRWSMFQMTAPPSRGHTAPFLWLPAALPLRMEGDSIEEVSIARDEMANLVWAVEDVVADGLGKGVEARLVVPQETEPALPPSVASVRYRLGRTVPENWVPFVAEHLPGSVQDNRFRRATMPPVGEPPVPPRRRSVVVTEMQSPYYIPEEEVPASGIIISRRAQRTRWFGGKTLLWIGRTKELGRGGANSGLGFDLTDDVNPAPAEQ